MPSIAYSLHGMEVEYTDEVWEWFQGLEEDEQDSIDVVVRLLESQGPHSRYPYSSGITTSKHAHMRELRIQHQGQPYRVLYAFNPLRAALLLLGGMKGGDDRWYDENVPIADRLYDTHLKELKKEGLL
jgi:hypothetical protein